MKNCDDDNKVSSSNNSDEMAGGGGAYNGRQGNKDDVKRAMTMKIVRTVLKTG